MTHAPKRATRSPVIVSVISRAHTRRFGPPTRLHDASRAHTRPSNSMTSWWCHFPLLAWPGSLEPTRIGDPVRIAWEKKLWPNLTLTLTKKSKISKKGLSHSVFAYIPILESVSLFETWKLCKLSNFQKLTFTQILTKMSKFSRMTCLPNFSRRFQFWGLFLHSGVRNCSNSMILQLLALMWTLTKNQDVWAKLVLFRFSHRFWLWNPLICFGLGNHLCDTLLRSTSSVQNLSSQDQNLRFIHLVWILSRLFSRLYQGFPFKVQMNSHKCILNLKLHWVTSSTYHSSFGAKQSRLPFGAYQSRIYHSHQKFSTTILDYTSTILRLSTINRRAGFIKNSSREKKKKKRHAESWNEDLLLSNFQILFLTTFSHYGLIIFNT